MLPCILHFISVLPLFGVTSGIPIPSSLLSNSAHRQVIAQRDLYTGEGTYYEVPGTGSCGQSDTDDESVVAVNQLQMNNGKSFFCMILSTDTTFLFPHKRR